MTETKRPGEHPGEIETNEPGSMAYATAGCLIGWVIGAVGVVGAGWLFTHLVVLWR